MGPWSGHLFGEIPSRWPPVRPRQNRMISTGSSTDRDELIHFICVIKANSSPDSQCVVFNTPKPGRARCSLQQQHQVKGNGYCHGHMTRRKERSMDGHELQPDEGQSQGPSKLKKFSTSLILSMAAFLVFVSAIALFVEPPRTAIDLPSHHRKLIGTVSPEIAQACQASQYPELCQSSLMKTPIARARSPGPAEVIHAAMDLSSEGAKQSYKLSQRILASASGNANITGAARNCLELLEASIRWISRSSGAPLETRTKDVKAWMSAALAYQTDCSSALTYADTVEEVTNAIAQMQTFANLTSNALSMADALDTYGTDTALWRPPRTERSGPMSAQNDPPEVIFPALREVAPNITVSMDNSSGFSSIQAAVDAAPEGSSQRFVIYIRAGVYREIVRVSPRKTNLMFLGDGPDRTIITGSMSAQYTGYAIYNSATVGVNGDGFVARDITFENAAGPGSHQAVALRVDSDLSAFQNCAFLGHQDTLYAHALRQFYRNCRIEGTHDFIFGNSASVFQGCSILVRPRQQNADEGEKDPVTAQGRTDPAQATGFVFWNCSVNGTEYYMRDFLRSPKIHRAYLGRPWKMYSRTVFLQSYLGFLIRPEGWEPWNGSFALDTLYYGEFENRGPGASVSGRVPWSDQIPPRAVGMYSVRSFIQGYEWLPNTL